jgi:hypothetical protein
VVEHLPSKHEVLSLNPSTAKKVANFKAGNSSEVQCFNSMHKVLVLIKTN